MGELLLFRPVGGQHGKDQAARGEPARILFFTGVRYQRMEPAAAAADSDTSAPPSGVGGAGRGRRKRRG